MWAGDLGTVTYNRPFRPIRLIGCSIFLLMTCNGGAIAATYGFDYKTLFLASSKLNHYFDPDSVVDDYIHLFRPGVWEKYHLDEFSFKKKEEEGLAALKADVGQFDLTKPIALRTDVDLGIYDTDLKGLPIEKFTPDTFWYVNQGCCTVIPSQIKVTFSNIEHFELLPVSEAAAKRFLERRSSGNLGDRRVSAEVLFIPSKVSGEDEIIGTILKVSFSDPQAGGALIGFVTQ